MGSTEARPEILEARQEFFISRGIPVMTLNTETRKHLGMISKLVSRAFSYLRTLEHSADHRSYWPCVLKGGDQGVEEGFWRDRIRQRPKVDLQPVPQAYRQGRRGRPLHRLQALHVLLELSEQQSRMRLRRLAEIPHRRDCDRGELFIYISLSLVANMKAEVRYSPTFHDVVGWRAFQADQR